VNLIITSKRDNPLLPTSLLAIIDPITCDTSKLPVK